MKNLSKISWQVGELEYRAEPSLSYSLIAKYAREGFSCLENLDEKISTPSLEFGSAVDTILTGTEEEFKQKFYITNVPKPTGKIADIINNLFLLYQNDYPSVNNMPDELILSKCDEFDYYKNKKDDSRIALIKEKGTSYYYQLQDSKNKIILDSGTYEEVMQAVNSIKLNNTTNKYFSKDIVEFDGIEKFYQLKFRSTIDNIPYKVMLDIIVVDHRNKEIYLCDLKTTSKPEYLFYESFVKWNYDIQSRIYTKVVKDNISKDNYFKDFTIQPFRFIVVNRYNPNPLVWQFDNNDDLTLEYNLIKLKNPFELGKELHYYISNNSKLPKEINVNKTNSIEKWLMKM